MIIFIFHYIAVKQFKIAFIVAHCKAKYIYTFTFNAAFDGHKKLNIFM